MKILCITYGRTGSHTFGRNLESKGFKSIHEPFTPNGYKDLEWPKDRKMLSNELHYCHLSIVWDHFVAIYATKSEVNTYLDWWKHRTDLQFVLLRRSGFEWALSSLHMNKQGEFADHEKRQSMYLDLQEVQDRIKEHTKICDYLLGLGLPVYYYEDLLEEDNNFPISMTAKDNFTISSKRDYILNYEELKEQLGVA